MGKKKDKSETRRIASVPADNTLSERDEMQCVLFALGDTLTSMGACKDTIDELVEAGDWELLLGSRRYIINIGVERIPYLAPAELN